MKRFQQIWPALAKKPVESFWNIVCICTVRSLQIQPPGSMSMAFPAASVTSNHQPDLQKLQAEIAEFVQP